MVVFLLLAGTCSRYNVSAGSITVRLQGGLDETFTLRLYGYSVFEKYEIPATQKGKYIIDGSLSDGVFYLNIFNGGPLLYEGEIIYSGSPVEVSVYNIENRLSLEFTDDTNREFKRFKKQSDSLLHRLSVLYELSGKYLDKKGQFYQDLQKEINHAVQSYNGFSDGFIEKGGLSSLCAAALKTHVPPEMMGPSERLDYMLSNFFKTFLPLESGYLNSRIYEIKLNEYMGLVFQKAQFAGGLDEDILIKETDRFLEKIKPDNQLTIQTLDFIRERFYKLSLDKALEYLDTQWYAGQCAVDDDPELAGRLELYERLAPGRPAPEIKGLGQNGQRVGISDLKAKEFVVVFWATWCDHCTKELPKIYSWLSSQKEVATIAIALDQEEQKWNQMISGFPGWKHIRAKEVWEDKVVKDYGIYATPTIYVLDENKNIKDKAKNLRELKTVLNR